MSKFRLTLLLTIVALVSAGAARDAAAQSGQKARERAPEPPAAQQPAQPAPKKAAARPAGEQSKTNSRGELPDGDKPHVAGANGVAEDPNGTRYVYDFSQPTFLIHTIRIEHDEAGNGFIRFERRSDIEQITEPLQLSRAALERIGARWAALDYLGSGESYQAPRDYPNLGRTRLAVRRGGQERSTEFNFSDKANAQGLADEYRRAAEQAVLVFELGVALESQPLEIPKLINKLESLSKSNFLSDPKQLVPLLRQLAEDERVPLIGRNHARRILDKLEK